MSIRVEVNGVVREFWDDATKTYKTFNAAGAQTSTRPFTAQETIESDGRIAADAAAGNESNIRTNIANDMANVQAIIDAGPNGAALTTQQIRDICRAIKRLDRMTLRQFDAAN